MKIQELSYEDQLNWLRLSRTKNVGPITFFKLLDFFGSVRAAIALIPDMARRGGLGKNLKVKSLASAEKEYNQLKDMGGEFVAACEPSYPNALRMIEDAPPILAVLGHKHLLDKRNIGIVGSRNASLNGRRFARDLAGDLGSAGYVIASGLARGIDTAAHEGSIDSGTIAVVAGGVGHIYPKENEKLHARIVEQGAVISECKMGQRPTARHFPRRNRIISGLAMGVVVVEAAKKSGSLITARQALDQGREVFAVPGSPLDPRTKGTNDLIRQGATLVESADDILHGLKDMELGEGESKYKMGGPPHEPINPNDFAQNELDQARNEILTLISHTPIQIDQVIREANIPTPIAMTAIFELELAGRIDRLPGNRIALT